MAAVLATLLCASGHAAVEFGARSEMRGRSSSGLEPPGQYTRDLQLDPFAALTAELDELSFALRYQPHLLWADAGGAFSRGLVQQRGELQAGLRLDPTVRVAFAQRLSAGTSDYSLLADPAQGAPQLPPDRPPPLSALRTVDSDSSLSLEARLSPRLRLNASAGYSVIGGTDEASRAALPLQQGPRGELSLSWLAARLDELSGTVKLQDTIFSTGRAVTVGELAGGWRSRLSRDTRSELSAGIAGVRAYGGESPLLTVDARPVLGAALEHDEHALGQRFSGALRLRLGPSIDRVSGAVYERAEGTLSLATPLFRDLSLAGRGGAAVPLEGALAGQALSTAELEARWKLAPRAALSLGVRAAFTGQGALAGEPSWQWLGYLAATLGDREAL